MAACRKEREGELDPDILQLDEHKKLQSEGVFRMFNLARRMSKILSRGHPNKQRLPENVAQYEWQSVMHYD